MTDVKSEICALASFLGIKLPSSAVKIKNNIPTITVDKNHPVEQYGTICRYLTKKNNTQICGRSFEEEALVYQWIEYRVTYIDVMCTDKDVENTLKELDSYLSDKVYMVGHRLSLADIVLYYGLHKIMYPESHLNGVCRCVGSAFVIVVEEFESKSVAMTYLEKQKYFNLARWFDQVQHTPNLRQSLPLVQFQRNFIYGIGEH